MMKKVTFSLPEETCQHLTDLSNLLGISRSAFLGEILTAPLAALLQLTENIPSPDSPPASVLRFRGESEKLIRGKITDLEGMADDLFQTEK